jgi:hypothetical protein
MPALTWVIAVYMIKSVYTTSQHTALTVIQDAMEDASVPLTPIVTNAPMVLNVTTMASVCVMLNLILMIVQIM